MKGVFSTTTSEEGRAPKEPSLGLVGKGGFPASREPVRKASRS